MPLMAAFIHKIGELIADFEKYGVYEPHAPNEGFLALWAADGRPFYRLQWLLYVSAIHDEHSTMPNKNSK